MPTAEGRSSLATPISKAATIALGIPLTEAAAAASRISYPPGERACCTASRLTKLRHCSDGLMTAGDLENLGCRRHKPPLQKVSYFFLDPPFFGGTLAPVFRAFDSP